MCERRTDVGEMDCDVGQVSWTRVLRRAQHTCVPVKRDVLKVISEQYCMRLSFQSDVFDRIKVRQQLQRDSNSFFVRLRVFRVVVQQLKM